MDNELNLDLDNIQDQAEQKQKVKNRFEELSEKVILTSKERDEKAKLVETLQGENSNISKERDFYKDFSSNVSKYPHAAEYQDKILEKVKAGYSTEDAMVAVLAKEGKLTSQPIQHSSNQVEGGSAPTTMEGAKDIKDMTNAERLEALKEAEKSGDLVAALRGGR